MNGSTMFEQIFDRVEISSGRGHMQGSPRIVVDGGHIRATETKTFQKLDVVFETRVANEWRIERLSEKADFGRRRYRKEFCESGN